MDAISIVLSGAGLLATGAVGLLVVRVLKDIEDLKKLYGRVTEMEVKVDELWADRTDSRLGPPYPVRKRRSTDR
jgi:hypothetical protein